MQPYGSLIKGALRFLWRTPEGIHTAQGVIWRVLKFLGKILTYLLKTSHDVHNPFLAQS